MDGFGAPVVGGSGAPVVGGVQEIDKVNAFGQVVERDFVGGAVGYGVPVIGAAPVIEQIAAPVTTIAQPIVQQAPDVQTQVQTGKIQTVEKVVEAQLCSMLLLLFLLPSTGPQPPDLHPQSAFGLQLAFDFSMPPIYVQ